MGRLGSVFLGVGILVAGCASVPETEVGKRVSFPREAYIQAPARSFEALGMVRSKVNFESMRWLSESTDLCENNYNKSVRELVKYAKERGADAVIEVRSVVALMDGKMERHVTPECFDDGLEGQILTEGLAVKWVTEDTLPSSMGAPNR